MNPQSGVNITKVFVQSLLVPRRRFRDGGLIGKDEDVVK